MAINPTSNAAIEQLNSFINGGLDQALKGINLDPKVSAPSISENPEPDIKGTWDQMMGKGRNTYLIV